jgi:hypothetical protein
MRKINQTDRGGNGPDQENPTKSEFATLTAAEYLKRWRARNPEKRREHNHSYYLRVKCGLPPRPYRLQRVLADTEVSKENEALAAAQAIDRAARRGGAK